MKWMTEMKIKNLLAGSMLILSSQSHATGIPMVDVANLVQNIMDYAQQLKSYSEDMYQSQVVANEYVQTLKDWEQTLVEWDAQLEQMKGISDAVDNGEWSKLIGNVELGYPLNPLDPYWENWDYDKLTDDGLTDIEEDIKKFKISNRNMADLYADIDAIYEDESNEMKLLQLYNAESKRQWVNDLSQHVYYHEKVAKPRLSNVQELNQSVRSIRESQATGDQTQLKTLQVIALQNEALNNAVTALLEIQTEENEFTNSEMFDRKVSEQREYSYRIKRMQEAKSAGAYVPKTGDNAHRSATF